MGASDVPVLEGGFAPIDAERVIELADVEGEIPQDLNGIHVRNGPNRRFEAPGRYHWFDGDGMLHSVEFDRGRARYRNRWIMTAGLSEELHAGRALWQGVKDPPRRDRPEQPLKNTSNTDVKFFAGDLLTMWYLGGTVYRSDPRELTTRGPLALDPRLERLPISAHSKVDERTGEFIFFAYDRKPPYMHYGVMDRSGALRTLMPIELPGPRLPHDMAITTNYTILHDLPLFHDQEALAAGRHKLRFHEQMPARFGIVPRHGSADAIRWFEADPTYLYHVSNSWEEDDGKGGTEIVMTGTPFRFPRRPDGSVDAARVPRYFAELDNDCMFYEWRFNLRTGRTRERVIDDLINTEFPVINSTMLGVRTRYSWNLLMGRVQRPEEPRFGGLARYDLDTGRCQVYHEGSSKWWNEAPFAPADNMIAEDDGYLVGFMTDHATLQSWCTVFDARDISRGPVARIRVPGRVPNGFHATWVSAERLRRGW